MSVHAHVNLHVPYCGGFFSWSYSFFLRALREICVKIKLRCILSKIFQRIMFYYFQIMPSLLSVLHVLILFLAIFPISRLQIRTQTNANSRFVQWMNGLFYLPRGNELRVRKEYRLLSDEERRNYHQAILLLKNDRVHSIIHTIMVSNTCPPNFIIPWKFHCFIWVIRRILNVIFFCSLSCQISSMPSLHSITWTQLPVLMVARDFWGGTEFTSRCKLFPVKSISGLVLRDFWSPYWSVFYLRSTKSTEQYMSLL